MNNLRKKAAELIRKMLSEEISPQTTIDRWPRNAKDNVLEEAFCLLYHYRDDSDIRKKDKRYAVWQREQFMEIARKLSVY